MPFQVTVEPVALLFLLTSYMILTGTQDLIYSKVCLSKYSLEVCENLYEEENENALNVVQSYSSYWMLGWNLLFTLPSTFSCQFLGSWSDSYGAKMPMLIPPAGSALSTIIYVCVSVYIKESPMSLIFLASLVAGTCGGYGACILTCMNYISKITNANERTVRISAIEGMIFIAGFSGPLLTSWIQKNLGRTDLYLIIMALQAVLVIYIVTYITDISPRYPVEDSVRKVFSLRHLRESVVTFLKPRPENRKLYILLLSSTVAVVKLCKACELDVTYIYLKDKPIDWNFSSYTYFISLTHALGAASLLCLLPFLRSQPDTVLLIVGLLSYLSGFILLSLASNSVMIYSVAALSSLSSWCLPIARSSVSKLIDSKELGKIFASLATIENLCLLIGTSVFNGLYPLTRKVFHGLVFIIAAILLLIPIGTSSYLHSKLKRLHSYVPIIETGAKDLEEEEEEYNDESILSSTFSVTSQVNLLDESSEPSIDVTA